MSAGISSPTLEPAGAVTLDPTDPADREQIDGLRARPDVVVIDLLADQRSNLQGLLPPADESLLNEPPRWVHYPWRRTLVNTLGPRAFRRVRLDRNRNLISLEEQDRLGTLRIGIVGLSVGHSIAHALAAEGLCGEVRLADFDELELTNLNRVPATLLDIGVNKAVVAAQRIAEIDPYLKIHIATGGVTPESVDEFVDGLDIVVEECDSLDIKVLVRQAARARRLPVLMASSDRGLIDVERFDEDPTRPLLHGLLGDTDLAALARLSGPEKVPYVLKVVEAGKLSARGAAALVEVGRTLSTWPQLAGDVLLGAAAVTRAVQRIGLGQPLASGRIRLDVEGSLEHLVDPFAAPVHPSPSTPDVDETDVASSDALEAVVAAAIRAPSGGNTQPWRITHTGNRIEVEVAQEYTSNMDVRFRASAISVGAAVFNIRVAAAAHGMSVSVDINESTAGSPLRAVCTLADGGAESDLGELYQAVLQRHTNRHVASPAVPIDKARVSILQAVAEQHGARLLVVEERSLIERVAQVIAETDRIRYLTPHLHADMMSELCWPEDLDQGRGIDVNGLEIGEAGLQALEILRRPEVMAQLAAWNAGQALGDEARSRLRGSSALAVLTIPDADTLVDYAHGGSALEAVWVAAEQHQLAVHPVSPVFLYARTDAELQELAPDFVTSLAALQREFRHLIGLRPGESEVLLLRLTHGVPQPSVRSRRRASG